ncbi:MAG: DNA-3-methyladenine glycosylase [Saprospiraceae bacterium]|nr:DNA-3-methyladenine glycosylase [Saprospiraceae bacterium]
MSTLKIPKQAAAVLSKDKVLRNLQQSVEINFPPSRGSVYEDLIEAIVYQQISIKAARSIFERFMGYFGGLVPPPAELAQAPHDALRALGLSNQKATYVRNIAIYFEEEGLTHEEIVAMDDPAIIQTLTGIKGVGVWTAQMILIFSLLRPDVFPVTDYGIQTAMKELYDIDDVPNRALIKQLEQRAEAWKPYRTYASLLLWSWKRKQMNV